MSESESSTPTVRSVDEFADLLLAALERKIQQRPSHAGDPDPQPDPVRFRTSRDFDVLTGLLGQSTGPLPLRMLRDREGIVVVDGLPSGAFTVVVESPTDRPSSPVTEHIDVRRRAGKPVVLPLKRIDTAMSVSRIEVLDKQGALIAFGPSLPALDSVIQSS